MFRTDAGHELTPREADTYPIRLLTSYLIPGPWIGICARNTVEIEKQPRRERLA